MSPHDVQTIAALKTIFGELAGEIPDTILCRVPLHMNINPSDTEDPLVTLNRQLVENYGIHAKHIAHKTATDFMVTAPYHQLSTSAALHRSTHVTSHDTGISAELVSLFYEHRNVPRVIVPVPDRTDAERRSMAASLSYVFGFTPPIEAEGTRLVLSLAQLHTLRNIWQQYAQTDARDLLRAQLRDSVLQGPKAPHGTPLAQTDPQAAEATMLGAGLNATIALGLTSDEAMKVLGLGGAPSDNEKPAHAEAETTTEAKPAVEPTPSTKVEGSDGPSKVVRVDFANRRRL